MNRVLATTLRLVVGVGVLVFLLVRIDGEAALGTLRSADPRWLGAALLAQLAAKSFWVLRWGRLLAAAGHPKGAGELLRLILLGLFFNNFLPTSVGGDVVRGIGLARDGVPRAHAAATVIADRVIGTAALAILAVVGGIVGTRLWPGRGPWGASALFALVLLGGIVIATRPQVLDRIGRLPLSGRFVAKGKRLLHQMTLLSGHRGAVAAALGLSVGLAVSSAVYHWSIGRALGLEIPLAGWFVIVPAVMLFAALPITLNGLGVRELGFVGLLGAQGVPEDRATLFALLAFVGTLGFAVAGGALFLLGDRSRTGGEA